MSLKVETIDHRRQLRQRFSVWIAFVALAIACLIARQAPGQEGDYVTAQMPERYSDERQLRQLESTLRSALTASDVTAESASWKAAQEYYTRYYMLLAAQPEPGAELTDLTYAALKNLDTAARSGSPAFRKALHGWIKEQSQKIAAGKFGGKTFHPAARINATLLLANLDTDPAAGGNPPVPDVSVAGVLVKQLYENEEVPMGVRVVALSGLRRHASLLGSSMPEGLRKYYLTKAKELLEGKAPAGLEREKTEPAAFGFMQRYAVDMVRALGTAEDHQWLAGRLTEIVADKDASPVIALYAARNVALLEEGIKELPVAQPTVVAWGDRAAKALSGELKRLKELDKPPVVTQQQSLAQASRQRGGQGSGGYGGYPEGYGEDYGSSGYPEGYGEDYGSSGYPEGYGEDYGSSGYPEGYGEGYGSGGYGNTRPAVKPQPTEVVAARRRLNANLEALLLGLSGSIDPNKGGGGLQVAAQDEAKTQLDDLLAALWTVADEVNDRSYSDRERFVKMLEEQSTTLDRWVARRQRSSGQRRNTAASERSASSEQPANAGVAAR